ncbi:hypothetical protein [Promicromonospora sukumoe]
MSTNPIVGYVVLAKRRGGNGYDHFDAVSAVWPDRDYVSNRREHLAAEAKHDGRDTEYIVGEIRGSA